MKEKSISTNKLFELSCLVTAIAVVSRLLFHAIQGAGWMPMIADGILAIGLFGFYGITNRSKHPLGLIVHWYLLTDQIAITILWICWGDLGSAWAPSMVLIILVYMLFLGEEQDKKQSLIVSGVILVVIFVVQIQKGTVGFNNQQYWAHYTQMTLYISGVVTLLLGIVNNRVKVEREKAKEHTVLLQKARKTAEQRRDLLMRLKDLQSDLFLEQDLQPGFDKLLQQLLEVTNSRYGFIGEVHTSEASQWQIQPHAHRFSPLFEAIPLEHQEAYFQDFFKKLNSGQAVVIENNPDEDAAADERYDAANYVGIPVTYSYQLVGAIVLTDCPEGYDEKVINDLSPFISTYGSIIKNIRLKRAQRKYENELREAKEIAEQSNRLKSQFLTNISHELRTPLSLILGPIDLLKKTDFKQLKEEQWLQQLLLIEKNSKKMLSYIQDIVDLSKLNSDTLQAKPSTINLQAFLERIYRQTKDLYSYRTLAFELLYEPENTIGVHTDPDKLERIVENILSNAFKYTKDGEQEHVTLQVKLLEKELQILCCDSGPGISPAHFTPLFNSFYQVEHPNESIFSGMGIGLALCKELSELLGIEISVRSKVGKGSCFIIHIPIQMLRKSPSTARFTANNAVSATKKQLLEASTNGHEKSLLVVEDNRDMRSFLKQILQSEYKVYTAQNGKEALEILEEYPEQFQLMITDLMMPEMDGFTLIEKVQGNAAFNHLPIIVLTAQAQFDNRLRNLRIGMDDYLTKPFEVGELQVMVKHLLKAKAARERRVQ
jgi:signal transduction histidine kinase/CheY-like chemotaxis protein